MTYHVICIHQMSVLSDSSSADSSSSPSARLPCLAWPCSPQVPSAGDWSIHRGGTVFIEGAENINVSGCFFDQSGAHLPHSRHSSGVSRPILGAFALLV